MRNAISAMDSLQDKSVEIKVDVFTKRRIQILFWHYVNHAQRLMMKLLTWDTSR